MADSGTLTKSLSLMPGPEPRLDIKPSPCNFPSYAVYIAIAFSDREIDALPFSLQVFHGNHDDRGVAETRLDRMVLVQFVRLLPHDFQNGIYLRLEIMGCGDG